MGDGKNQREGGRSEDVLLGGQSFTASVNRDGKRGDLFPPLRCEPGRRRFADLTNGERLEGTAPWPGTGAVPHSPGAVQDSAPCCFRALPAVTCQGALTSLSPHWGFLDPKPHHLACPSGLSSRTHPDVSTKRKQMSETIGLWSSNCRRTAASTLDLPRKAFVTCCLFWRNFLSVGTCGTVIGSGGQIQGEVGSTPLHVHNPSAVDALRGRRLPSQAAQCERAPREGL